MRKELDPCPFCGGKAELSERKVGGDVNIHMVIIRCTRCTAKMDGVIALGTNENFRAEIAGKWNNRV